MSATWVTRTPAIRDGLHASTAEMGGLLFGVSVGAMVGVLASQSMVQRLGSRTVAASGVSCTAVGLLIVAVGSSVGSAAAACVGFALFGLGVGLTDVALNIAAAAIEAATDTHVLPVVHGSFSLGTVVGACLGIAASAAPIAVWIHLCSVAVLVWVLMICTLRWMPAKVDAAPEHRDRLDNTYRAPWRDRSLLAIGLVVAAIAMSEGAANDWLPLIFVDGYHVDQAAGSVLYAAFAAAMTVGRFCGGPLLTRFGHANVIRAAVITTIAGIGVVVCAPNAGVGVAAVVLWGLGASLGFPVAISAAGRHPHDGPARVALVSTAAYFSFLVGPPALGFAGEHVGLRDAMLILVALLCVALVFTIRRRPARRASVGGQGCTGGFAPEPSSAGTAVCDDEGAAPGSRPC
jgi:fucose permease